VISRSVKIALDVISQWWFGRKVIVGVMDNSCVSAIPDAIILTPNCHSSDISTMSTREGESAKGSIGVGADDDSDSDTSSCGTNDSVATMRQKLQKMKKKMEKSENKRKQEMTDLEDQLKDSKQAKLGKVGTRKRINRIKDLAAANTLPLDKQISLNNFFRDAVFRRVKIVTKEVLKDGTVVGNIMKHLQFVSEQDRNMYRAHIELALQAKIGQYRDNSVKNIKWKYRTRKGKGTSK